MSGTALATGRVTLGVVVAIPEPHATVLTGWRRRVGDEGAGLIWPHVTLLPPTSLDADGLVDVEQHLAAAAASLEPFPMHLAGTGTFRPVSPVVFIQVATGVAQCELLERAIRCGPLERELDFPYHPHVTVAHDVGDDSLDDAYEGLSGFVARFPVNCIVLFTRDGDGTWSRYREFPLGPSDTGQSDTGQSDTGQSDSGQSESRRFDTEAANGVDPNA